MYNSFDFICDKAERLKAKYDETNPLKLARQMGIKVLYAPMGRSVESCKGFYLTHCRIRTITINSDLSSDFQKIICSHELGHAVLHNKQAGVGMYKNAYTSNEINNNIDKRRLMDGLPKRSSIRGTAY